jgi:hypothetical protein
MDSNQGARQGGKSMSQGYQMQRLAKQLESKVYISAMIQPVPKLKKERKSISRQVNLAISSPPATTEYLQWSNQPVRFSRADHPRKVPRPEHAPMVLKAQIGGYNIGRVFMDAGSSINLIYARTLRAMCISLESLKPTDCSFHEIVPGSANYPLRKIELDVCFGNSNNYRRESWSSKSWIGLRSIMQSWGTQHLQNSWQYLTTHISRSKSQDPKEQSWYRAALKYPTLMTRNSIGWHKLLA